MLEAQQPEPDVREEMREAPETPPTAWPLPAIHRRPAVALLLAVLIVLQVVLAALLVVQARKLLDLGERIERLEER